MIKYIFTLLIFLLQCFTLFAGSFRPLSIKEGLSSRQVFQVSKDSAGFIWAYTHMGVDRYDGNEIKHYQLDETVESKDHILSSTTMACDYSGNIWIALKNGKIYAYDNRTDAFQLRVDASGYLSFPVLNNILFDVDNRLWLCMSTGVYCWEEKSGLLLAGLKGQCVNCIVQIDDTEFCAGTNKGIYRLKRANKTGFSSEEAIPLPAEMHVESLCAFGDKLFVGTFSDGAFVVDKSTRKVRSFKEFIPHVPIRTFAQAPDNTLLIGADGAGVFQIDRTTERLLKHYITNEDDERSLNGNTVSDICVDEFGGIWVSTSTNGISYLDPNIPDVRRMKHEQNNANSLKSDHINVIFQDSEGDCWYGTNNGVSLYRHKQRQWKHFLDGTEHGSKVVLALAEDSRGNIWVGGYGIGLYAIHKGTGKVQKMEKRKTGSDKGVALITFMLSMRKVIIFG